jgi:polysaccharide pyruvyl transferase WcaK-like protein
MPMRFRTKLCSLQGQEEYGRLIKIFAQVVDHLADQQEAQIIFVPMRSIGSNMDPGQDDDRVSREIINLMRIKERAYLLQGDYSPEELKAVFGEMNLVISMRMHALIMASMMGVPVIGLNISPKFTSFFQMIRQESYLIDVKHVDFNLLLSTIETALSNRKQIAGGLRSQAHVLQEAAFSNNKFIGRLLE